MYSTSFYLAQGECLTEQLPLLGSDRKTFVVLWENKKEGRLTQPLVHKRTRPSSKVNEGAKIDLIDFFAK